MKLLASRANRRRPGLPCALLAALAFTATMTAQSGSESPSLSMPTMPNIPSPPRIRGMIYFPPLPPPLDRPVPRAASIAATGRGNAPVELAAHVGEFFYPQLASRLTNGDPFPAKLRQAVGTYHGGKQAALRELRAELEKARGHDAPTRLRTLEAFARRQAPKLAELEKASEQLRRDLLESDRDWSDFREWRLNDPQRRGYSPSEIAQVMRAYAYFQPGMTPAQRRLLLEVAIDLISAVDNAAKAAPVMQPFFSPEPARIALPDDASPEIAARFALYQSKKAVLKKQLYDTVYSADGASFNFFQNPLKALAQKQAPAFDELEKIAEEIRRGVNVPPPAPKPGERSPLPAPLVTRLMALQTDRSANQREASAKADALSQRVRDQPVRINYRYEDDGMKFVIFPLGRGGTGVDKKLLERLNGEMAEIVQRYGNRLAEIVNERDAIRAETGVFLGTKDAAAIDNALNTAARAALAQENADAYAEYRTAVWEPGLSIEQRRLLLDGALQRLDLPLPRGEMQPQRRGNAW